VQDKASKCHVHGGSKAVARCDGCGAWLCISCAVPVRGQVLGQECLPDDLKTGPPPLPPGRVRQLALPLAGIGFAIATLSAFLPWKRYGLGSGAFGAWGMTWRWSILAATASVLGLALWSFCAVSRRWTGRRWVVCLRTLAILALGATALHFLRKPGFGPHSIGPWVAALGATVALIGTGSRR